MSATAILIPQPWPTPAPDTWISATEFCRLTGWDISTGWLRRQVGTGNVLARETQQKLPNGRYEREYAVASLPPAARSRYEAEQARLAVQQTSLPLFPGPQLIGATVRPVQVPSAKEGDALGRQAVLDPILAVRDARGHERDRFAALRLQDGTPVTSVNTMVEYQREHWPLAGKPAARRTILRWLKAHREHGIAGLAKRPRNDKGQSRILSRPEYRDAGVLLKSLHLGDGMSPGLSPQACYEMLAAQRETVGLAERELPCYDTVRLYLAGIPAALKVYATRGRKEFAERMMPYISRSYTEPSNAIWISDHAIMDVEVLNDCIPGAPIGTPIRLRLTAILDYRSRYLVGYSWAWEGTSASIATALRFAISAHGPCELWYCDNGKDFRKVAKGAMPGYLRRGSLEPDEWATRELQKVERTGVLARLGIQVTHCIAHHPQSKHIERFFRTVHLTFCRLFPTYTGGTPSERPDHTTALMEHTRKLIRKGDISGSHHPLASELMQRFAAWLPMYHGKRHGGRGMDGRCPAEVLAAERNPNQRPAPHPEDLAWLLWEHKTAKVRECQVRVNKQDYAPVDALQARLMLDRNETTVSIAYDPLDPSSIGVLDQDGRLVTMLSIKRELRMAPDDPETQRQIGEMQKMRSGLTRDLRERRAAITHAGKQLGVLHPMQLLGSGQPEAPAIEAGRITARKPKTTLPAVRPPQHAYQFAAEFLRQKASK
jgi:putative transposase